MVRKFSLKKARDYVLSIKEGKIKNPFQNSDSAHSLKEFAKIKDEESFRRVVDFMAHFISKAKEGGLKFFKSEPLTFIECVIMTLDHGDKANYILVQISRGLKIKRPSIKRTQKYFQKLYGSQFFVDNRLRN